MSVSTTSTINMNGNSTGYGAASGTEAFNVGGYYNSLQFAGASETVNVLSGLFDNIDLNSTGFTGAVTDSINLGASAFDQIISSHALYGATISVTASGGPNTISLLNHNGQTNIALGYVGDPALQGPGLGNSVSLNGDAINTVSLASGGGATVFIGSAADGLTAFSSAITLTGTGNTLTAGDETITVTNATSNSNSISLGNGNDSVSLTGNGNVVALGNGANLLTLAGGLNTVSLGSGANVVNTAGGLSKFTFAAGNAGVQDTINMSGGPTDVHGGDENFTITSAARGTYLGAKLGNGSNTINMAFGNAKLTVGTSTANTGTNVVTLGHGDATATFNGGQDIIMLNSSKVTGADHVTLNGTMLGTQLTTTGAFNTVTLTQDANATINDTGVNAGLNITLDADLTHGFGAIAITGLAQDDLAQIHMVNAGSYSVTTDSTALGGITLHFAHGSVDLVGMSAVPNHLFV